MNNKIQDNKENEIDGENFQISFSFMDDDELGQENLNRVRHFPPKLDSSPIAHNVLDELFDEKTEIVKGSYSRSIPITLSTVDKALYEIDKSAVIDSSSDEIQVSDPKPMYRWIMIRIGLDVYDNKKVRNSGKDVEQRSFRLIIFLAGLTLPADLRDDMIGYHIERYNKQKVTVGATYAQLWMLKDVGASMLPVVYEILRSRTVKILKRLGLEIVLKYFLG